MCGKANRWLIPVVLLSALLLNACVQRPVKNPTGTSTTTAAATRLETLPQPANVEQNTTAITAIQQQIQQQQWLAAKAAQTQQNQVYAPITGEMITIAPGCFSMGSSDAASFANERPVHQVCLPAFRLGRTEVTFSQYDRFARATGRELPNDEGWGRQDHPVINISWEDARAFTRWASKQTGLTLRLPSEAEWEYAARAGSTTKYTWGDSIHCDQARYGYWDCNSRSTKPVGSYPGNAFGLFDMHGNVWEFVEDCWNDSYFGAPVDGSAWLQGDCSYRVVRGGSWNDSPGARRAAFRGKSAPSYRFNFLGFRLAQDL